MNSAISITDWNTLPGGSCTNLKVTMLSNTVIASIAAVGSRYANAISPFVRRSTISWRTCHMRMGMYRKNGVASRRIFHSLGISPSKNALAYSLTTRNGDTPDVNGRNSAAVPSNDSSSTKILRDRTVSFMAVASYLLVIESTLTDHVQLRTPTVKRPDKEQRSAGQQQRHCQYTDTAQSLEHMTPLPHVASPSIGSSGELRPMGIDSVALRLKQPALPFAYRPLTDGLRMLSRDPWAGPKERATGCTRRREATPSRFGGFYLTKRRLRTPTPGRPVFWPPA